MPEVDPVSLRLFVEDNQARTALNRYERVADRTFSAVQRGALAVERTLGGLSGVLAGVSAVALAKTFLEIADTAKSLDAQLRLATAGFGTFAQAQDDVRRVAAETRSDLTDTGSLYGSFARTAKELGASQMEAAQGTETFSKALKIGGAGTAQVQSATLQLGQALASTNVQWEELGQILEASPRLAKVFTDSLGVTRQQLKQMASDGKLSGEMLFKALNDKKITEGIDREFAGLPVTFEQAMTQVTNAAVITFGAFDRGGQFSTALANFITQGSSGFKDLEQDAVNMGIAVRSSIEGLSTAFDPLFERAKSFFEYMKSGIGNLDIDVGKELGTLDKISNTASNYGFPGALLKRFGGVDISTNLEADYRRGQQASELRLRRQNGQTPASRVLNRLSDANRAAGQAGASRSTAPSAGGKKKSGPSAESLARKAEQERERAIRDEASSARESAQLQDDITAAKAALAVATRDILQFNLDQIASEEQQRIAEYTTQRKLGRLSDQELADRTKAVNEIADLQRQRVWQIADENEKRDELAQVQAANQNDQDLLRAQSDLTDSRLTRRDIELRLVDLAYEQERNELDAVVASNTATQAQKDIAEARLRILDSLKGSEVERTNRQYESPLQQKRRQVRETTANMGDRSEDIQVNALDRLTDGLADASTEYIKLGGIAGDVINSIIRDLVKLAAQQAIFGKAGGGGILGSIGGLFGLGGSAAGLGINTAAATAGASYDFSAFKGFSSGGYTGSGPRDQPAGIVHKGEYVIPADAVQRIGVQNLAAMSNARAAASMAGVTAAGAGARPVQQTVILQVEANDYFDAKVKQEAAGVAAPMAMASGVQARSAAGSDVARQVRRRMPGR